MFDHPSFDKQATQPTKKAQPVCAVKPLCHKPGNDMTMPGVRCPSCQRTGKETWVIPGKYCHICGTPC
ncbi:hypothetical protein BJX66DRAFT_103170 [Aspergillus keveii]|uniref:Uncharacterized protein n=1 Tax=Aspergillus keveii TaxID=714993 RepID=A0ABR4GPD8_9EURO